MAADIEGPHGLRALARALADRDAMFRETVKEAIKEIEALRKLKDFDDAMNHAAAELPEGWQIEIGVERHAGWIGVIDPGGKKTNLHLEGPNALIDAVLEGIDHAKEAAVEPAAIVPTGEGGPRPPQDVDP